MKKHKLELQTETIRVMQTQALAGIAGGGMGTAVCPSSRCGGPLSWQVNACGGETNFCPLSSICTRE